jgi:predicted SprT family Zn-dependent metalloprotease
MFMVTCGTARAASMARELMNQHGLWWWTFQFNRGKRMAGLCKYSYQTIELSQYFVNLNSEAFVRDIILHEIAHALAGSTAGHGPVWKMKCRAIGANPKRLCSPERRVPGNYTATCNCGVQHQMYRKPKHKYACKTCRAVLTFS